MHLFSEHSDQKRELATDFEDLQANAIEEVLRWCSPVLHMRRTTTNLGAHDIAKGDKVVVWCVAANHDRSVFADPSVFDIRRTNAREHYAFDADEPQLHAAGAAGLDVRPRHQEPAVCRRMTR